LYIPKATNLYDTILSNIETLEVLSVPYYLNTSNNGGMDANLVSALANNTVLASVGISWVYSLEDISKFSVIGHTHAADSTKVDKVEGKGLSTNDLTNELKIAYDAAASHAGSAHAPSNAQKNSDITKEEIEAKLTGEISSHSHAASGGSSLWTLMPGNPVFINGNSFRVTGDVTNYVAKCMIVKWTESSVVKCAMVDRPSTYSSPDTTVTLVGDTMASIDAGSLKYCMFGAEMFIKKFVYAGTIGATGTDVMNRIPIFEPMRYLGADMADQTAGTTNSTTVNIINETGTVTLGSPSLASTVRYTPTPAAPASSGLSVAAGDSLYASIAAVQTTAAVDCYVDVYLFPTRYLYLT